MSIPRTALGVSTSGRPRNFPLETPEKKIEKRIRQVLSMLPEGWQCVPEQEEHFFVVKNDEKKFRMLVFMKHVPRDIRHLARMIVYR